MGALDNIRVVDFGHYVAGPVTGMLLADQGAEVIKIDPPDGPKYKTEANATWNRGKRSITLDLKRSEELTIARALIDRADIVIENFRPGVMDRLGLGEAEARAVNPGLIYAAIPAFGTEDPRAAMPGWEGVVLAAVDGFRPAVEYREMVQQLHRKPEDREGNPTFTAEPIASMFAALLSSVGIASALAVRDKTGRGQRVEVPLFDAMIQATGVYSMAQLPFKPTHGAAMNPWDHQYKCSDGRWIHIACNQPSHAAKLAELIDRPDFIERGLTERRLPNIAAHHELILALTLEFASNTADLWELKLIENGLPGSVCRSGAEWLEHPQAKQGDLFVDVDDIELGPTRQPAPLVELSRSPSEVSAPAPRPDQHRTSILSELAGSPPLPRPPASAPISLTVGPLDGVRVLDVGTVLSGPSCGRTLAELGADVIKIDDPGRGGVLFHHDVNRGKRSILLDFDTDDGFDVFWDLVEQADIIIENFPAGEAKRLGIGYEALKEEKPDVIYISINAYGDTGPWADLEGQSETVEALTGLQVRFGGDEQPAVWPYGLVSDYGTGYAAALGAVLALLDKNITGEGQKVSATLAKTAGLLQSMFLIDHADKEWSEPSGPMALGFNGQQSLYECEDGWIYFGASKPGQLEPILGDIDKDVETKLVEWCEQRTAADAVDHLVKHGMGAQELTWLHETMMDPVVVRRGLSVVREHEGLGLLRTTGPAPWLSRSMINAGRAAGHPGSDAESILADVDRSDELDRMVKSGVILLP